MMLGGRWIVVVGAVWAAAAGAAATPASGRPVEAAARPGKPFVPQPTTTLTDLPPVPVDAPLDSYGGLASRRVRGTGFFRAERIDGRWWLIDPDGAVFISRGMNSVTPVRTAGGREALERRFGSEKHWAAAATAELRAAGFNTAGAWSAHDLLDAALEPLAATRLWSFMAASGKKRGGPSTQAGPVG